LTPFWAGNILEDTAFEKLALRSCRELIRRAAIIQHFSMGIVDQRNENAKSFTDSAHIIAHEEFPYNGCYSAGWMRQSYDIYIEARQHRHGLHPELPLLVSEYGDWEYYAQNAGFNQQEWKDLLEEERTSRQPRFAGEKRMLQQALNIQKHITITFLPMHLPMLTGNFDYNRGMAPIMNIRNHGYIQTAQIQSLFLLEPENP
jgi:beta-galactosidase